MKSQWISVEEIEPRKAYTGKFAFLFPGSSIAGTALIERENGAMKLWGYGDTGKMTHWMPLPELQIKPAMIAGIHKENQ